jgi:hypothetical protein
MSPDRPTAIVAGKVYALGGCVALDGRVSWAPPAAGRFQAITCYLLREGDESLLIDIGVPAHVSAVMHQLKELLAPGSPLKVFLTRAELDAVGNLAVIREAYDVRYVMAGGSVNPFDGYDDASSARDSSRPALPVVRTSGIDLAEGRQIRVIVPLFRFLPTYWPFDIQTRTLFTSDVFGFTDQAEDQAPEVRSSASEDPATLESVVDHLFRKFWWLPGSDPDLMKKDVVSIFRRSIVKSWRPAMDAY